MASISRNSILIRPIDLFCPTLSRLLSAIPEVGRSADPNEGREGSSARSLMFPLCSHRGLHCRPDFCSQRCAAIACKTCSASARPPIPRRHLHVACARGGCSRQNRAALPTGRCSAAIPLRDSAAPLRKCCCKCCRSAARAARIELPGCHVRRGLDMPRAAGRKVNRHLPCGRPHLHLPDRLPAHARNAELGHASAGEFDPRRATSSCPPSTDQPTAETLCTGDAARHRAKSKSWMIRSSTAPMSVERKEKIPCRMASYSVAAATDRVLAPAPG